MSQDHKRALAIGRSEGRAVRAYLEALESSRPKRGRKRTRESVQARLANLAAELESADPLKRLQLVQEKLDLDEELTRMDEGVDMSELEAEFVKVAKSYASRKGISYSAFRQIGIPASILKQAGLSRSAD